jgi:cobalt-zinc-cadmium resistance protein CzcA
MNKPEFSGRFFSQRVWGAKDPFTGFSVSAAFPLFGASAYQSKVKVATAQREVQEKSLAYQTQQIQTQKASALTSMEKNMALLNFYEGSGLRQAEEIIKAASLSYRVGEISFAELSQFLSQAIGIRQAYLDVLNEYNQSVIQFNYYNNK